VLEKLDNDQVNRLWEHKLHVEDNFYNRLNFFLVFESLFLSSAVSAVFNHPPLLSGKIVLIMITCLGFLLTILWGYAQARQKYLLDDLRIYLHELLPEYEATHKRRDKVKWPISSMNLLTYLVPPLIGLVWLALLVVALIS
jgi:hypothetical protein